MTAQADGKGQGAILAHKPDLAKAGSLDDFVMGGAQQQAPTTAQAPVAAVAPQMVEKMVKFNLELPETLRMRIKVLSATTNVPMNKLILDVLSAAYPEPTQAPVGEGA